MINLKPLSDKAFAASKVFNGDGTDNYAYAAGYFQTSVERLLNDLQLSYDQKELLEKYLQNSK